MITKKVKIMCVSPVDKFNLVGKQGNLDLDSLEIRKRLFINYEERYLHTSPIEKIEELKTGVLVTTRNNSVYELTYL